MPRTSKSEAPIALDIPSFEGRYVDLGEFTVGYEHCKEDTDPAPFFVGLPDDRCQSPHWGVVNRGQIVFRFADHDETYRAGDAYYAPPGHLPFISADTELIEFSPTAALGETMAQVEKNMQALAPQR
jgi:hypothetical protein